MMGKGSLLCHLLSICSFQIPSPVQWKKTGMCWVCVLCFSLIENREDVEGMQRHFPLCFCGWLNQWLHHWIQEQANRVIFLSWITGLQTKTYHARKWIVKFIGASWDCSEEHLVEQTLIEGGVCLWKRRVAGKRCASRQSKWKFLIASLFREKMKETHSRVYLSPAPCACTPSKIALWFY